VNLASRCAGFIEKRFDGQLAAALPEPALYERFAASRFEVQAAYARNEPASVLRLVMGLADEANRYIDEQKPWILAKDESQADALHAVCTQGLNLFRVLVALLKPVLPRTASEAETFLDNHIGGWSDVDAPLLSTRIAPYKPLFTRIDPARITAMIDASKESLKPTDAGTASAAPVVTKAPEVPTPAPAAAAVGTIDLDAFSRLDLRVATVLECAFVEGSDKLLRFKLDAGELGQRQVLSGIRTSDPDPDALVGRQVVFIANLAPRKMRFGVSEGMILSAGSAEGRLHLLAVDDGAAAGMSVK